MTGLLSLWEVTGGSFNQTLWSACKYNSTGWSISVWKAQTMESTGSKVSTRSPQRTLGNPSRPCRYRLFGGPIRNLHLPPIAFIGRFLFRNRYERWAICERERVRPRSVHLAWRLRGILKGVQS